MRPRWSHHHMLLRRPSRLGRSRRPQVKLKPRGWFGARNALLRGRSKRSPRWRRLLWRFERLPSEIGRLGPTKAVACRRCLQLSFGRGYLLLQIFRDPGVQRPPKQGKLRHWVVVTIVVSRQLLAWHARCIHASIKEAGVDGGVERWWHPKGNNQTACRSRAEQPRACVPATRHAERRRAGASVSLRLNNMKREGNGQRLGFFGR